MSDKIDELISALNKNSQSLEDLVRENERLRSSPFDLTQKEKLDDLSERVALSSQKLDESLEKANKKFKGLFENKDNLINDINEAYKKIEKEVKKIKKTQKELEKIDKESDPGEYNKVNKKLERQVKNLNKMKNLVSDVDSSFKTFYNNSNRELELLNKRFVDGVTIFDDLNEATLEVIISLIKQLATKKCTLVVATKKEWIADKLCKRKIYFKYGSIVDKL
jgi:chromosome segregation ATPase